jgi:hypothetical protein
MIYFYSRTTASKYLDFVKNWQTYCKNLWLNKDLSNIPAIKWGRDMEHKGIEGFERKMGSKVTKCGLFISKENPHIGEFYVFILQLTLIILGAK